MSDGISDGNVENDGYCELSEGLLLIDGISEGVLDGSNDGGIDNEGLIDGT